MIVNNTLLLFPLQIAAEIILSGECSPLFAMAFGGRASVRASRASGVIRQAKHALTYSRSHSTRVRLMGRARTARKVSIRRREVTAGRGNIEVNAASAQGPRRRAPYTGRS